MSRKDRSEQLFKGSVIIAAVLIVVLYFAIAITGFEKAKGATTPKAPRVSLPQACEHLRVEYTDDQWNEETDTYPINHPWEKCMGIGRQ